jgi:hypothetical protein
MVPSLIPGRVFRIYVTGLTNLATLVRNIVQKQEKPDGSLRAEMFGVFVLLLNLPGKLGNTVDLEHMRSIRGILKKDSFGAMCPGLIRRHRQKLICLLYYLHYSE